MDGSSIPSNPTPTERRLAQEAEARAAHGDDLFAFQLEWEATMWEVGTERTRGRIDRQFAGGQADYTPGGGAALHTALASVEAGFARWMAGGELVSRIHDEAARTAIALPARSSRPGGKRGPKPNTDYMRYLSRLSAREIASITIRCMMKGVFSERDGEEVDQIAVRNSIMHAIGAATKRAMFAAEEGGANLLHAMDKDNQRKGYSKSFRRKRFERTFEERFAEWWDEEDMDQRRRGTLAQWLMVGAIHNSDPQLFTLGNYYTGKTERRAVILPTEHLLKIMQDRNTHAELHSPLVLPFAIPPRRWEDPSGGAYWSPGSPLLKIVKGAGRDHMEELREASEAGDLLVVYNALNAAQDTAWRINRRVFETAEWVRQHIRPDPSARGSALLPHFEPLPLPPELPQDATAAQIAERKRRARSVYQFNSSEYGRRRQVDEVFSSAGRLLDRLTPGGLPLAYSRFHYAFSLDYRGRMYALQNGLQPQGNKLARALLEFADGVPISSEEGERWLMIHVANCFGQDKASLEERVAWLRDAKNNDRVCRIGRAPTETLGLWAAEGNVAKFEPWLALRAAIEWAAYQEAGGRPDGSFVSHLPVSLDGSCNGLQHLAKLSGDDVLGRLVNIIDSEDGKRRDVYEEVAAASRAFLIAEVQAGRDIHEPAEEADGDGPGEVFHGIYGDILELGLADRSMAKHAVMTIPYGASQFGSIKKVEATVRERIAAGKLGANSPPQWVLDLKELGRAEDTEELRAKRRQANARLKRLVGRLNDVLWKQSHAQTSSAQNLMRWMKKAADLMSTATPDGLPVCWTTPANFPAVLAEYVTIEATPLRAEVKGVGGLRMRHRARTSKIDRHEQRKALAPGFVHSLDAAHMMLTVQSAQARGVDAFALVHDSFGTHAQSIPQLREALSVAFQRCYAVDPLASLHDGVVGALREARGAEFGFGGDGGEPNSRAEDSLGFPERGELAFSDAPLGEHAFA